MISIRAVARTGGASRMLQSVAEGLWHATDGSGSPVSLCPPRGFKSLTRGFLEVRGIWE